MTQTAPNSGLPLATDPPVSEAQRRAMWAAAKGESTLGIPKKVGEEFVGKDAKFGAGTLLTTPDGLALFLKRGGSGDHPGEWCLPGGGVDDEDRSPEDTARRETMEETGFRLNGIKPIHRGISDEGIDFVTYHQEVNEAFHPKLNNEHVGYAWAPLSDPPGPLHAGVKGMLGAADEDWPHAMKISLKMPNITEKLAPTTGMDEHIALDAASVREYDKDGRLHVELTNISKANICPYVGNEIPDWQGLGLDPGKLYQLLRDPDELEKAAVTSNGVPILFTHKPVSAKDHDKEITVGATGTDAVFKDPYLKNSLVIWPEYAIDAIESEEQKELSCGYHYRADMTPGTYMGAHYDGVMRDIVFNHVALVKEGRAGSDVVVGDSRETINRMETNKMSAKPLSRKATLAQGALIGYLRPLMAQDATLPDLSILEKVTAKNYGEHKAALAAACKDVKLAKDAKLDGLPALLDSLDKLATDEFPLPEKKDAEDEDPDDKDKKAMDAEGIKNFLKDKISEDDMKALDAIMGGEAPALKPDVAGKDEEEDKVDQKAMDAAIDKVKKQSAADLKLAVDGVTKTQMAIRDAEKRVRPWVGELAQAHDSAESVLRTALKMLKVKGIDDVKDPAALGILLDSQPLPGAKLHQDTTIALDASVIDSFDKLFPSAKRIGNIG